VKNLDTIQNLKFLSSRTKEILDLELIIILVLKKNI